MRRKENLTFQPPPSGLFSMLHTRPATGLESCVFNASQPPFFSGEAVFQIKMAVSSKRTGFCLSPTSGKLESDCSRFAVWTAVVCGKDCSRLRFGLAPSHSFRRPHCQRSPCPGRPSKIKTAELQIQQNGEFVIRQNVGCSYSAFKRM